MLCQRVVYKGVTLVAAIETHFGAQQAGADAHAQSAQFGFVSRLCHQHSPIVSGGGGSTDQTTAESRYVLRQLGNGCYCTVIIQYLYIFLRTIK